LFVSDGRNCRVEVYTLNADNSILTASGGHSASYALGQTTTGGNISCDGLNQMNMTQPRGLAVDPVNQRLYVVDGGGDRLLVFSTASVSNGENASYVLGEPDFFSNGGGSSASQLTNPSSLSYDPANSRLFVSDGVGRVLVFNVSPAVIANGESAINSLGEGCLGCGSVSNGAGFGSWFFEYNNFVFYDPASSRLFVSDGANRVLIFEGSYLSGSFLNIGPGL
jgi:hypothetical protein